MLKSVAGHYNLLDEREAKTLLAAKLYEKGSLLLGQAAHLAGYSKRTFMELLGNYEVSVFDYSECPKLSSLTQVV